MDIFKRIFNKAKSIITGKSNLPFFTRDYFKGKKYIIGEYTYGTPLVIFENKDANLTIGKFCSISHDVTIFLGGNHRTDWVTTYPFNVLTEYFPEASHIKGHPATKGDVVIGHDVWIGRGVTILSGITVGNGAVLATNAVITKNVGPYEIWGGNPARFIKKRFSENQIEELEKMEWWNWSKEEIMKKISYLCSNPNIE